MSKWMKGPGNSACQYIDPAGAGYVMTICRAHNVTIGTKRGGWRWELVDKVGVSEMGYVATRAEAMLAAEGAYARRTRPQ